jgi:hypothetical protein
LALYERLGQVTSALGRGRLVVIRQTPIEVADAKLDAIAISLTGISACSVSTRWSLQSSRGFLCCQSLISVYNSACEKTVVEAEM